MTSNRLGDGSWQWGAKQELERCLWAQRNLFCLFQAVGQRVELSKLGCRGGRVGSGEVWGAAKIRVSQQP